MSMSTFAYFFCPYGRDGRKGAGDLPVFWQQIADMLDGRLMRMDDVMWLLKDQIAEWAKTHKNTTMSFRVSERLRNPAYKNPMYNYGMVVLESSVRYPKSAYAFIKFIRVGVNDVHCQTTSQD